MKRRNRNTPEIDPRLQQMQLLQQMQSLQQDPKDMFGIIAGMQGLDAQAQRLSQEAQMQPELVRGATLQNNQLEQSLPYIVKNLSSVEPQRLLDNTLKQSAEKRFTAEESRNAAKAPYELEQAKLGPKVTRGALKTQKGANRRADKADTRAEDLHPWAVKAAELGPQQIQEEINYGKTRTQHQQQQNDLFDMFGEINAGNEMRRTEAQTESLLADAEMKRRNRGWLDDPSNQGLGTSANASVLERGAAANATPEERAAAKAYMQGQGGGGQVGVNGASQSIPTGPAGGGTFFTPYSTLGSLQLVNEIDKNGWMNAENTIANHYGLGPLGNPRELYFRSQGLPVPPSPPPADNLWDAILRSWPGTEAYKNRNNKK
jgi:hypothetical protein